MKRNKRSKGFSLVELMIGVVIGFLAIYASFRIFENAEKNYRAVETINEAQMSGLYATFVVTHELGNAGAGMMSNFGQLQSCTTPSVFPDNGADNAPLPLYPLPVAIIPGDDEWSDDIYVSYGTGSITDLPMSVSAVSPPQSFSMMAPLGLARGSVLVATAGARCEALAVQAATPPDTNGSVGVTVGAGQSTANVHVGDFLVDLGSAIRHRFFVDGNGVLQMETWRVNASGGNNNWQVASTVPVASNVVAFKAQYGVALTGGAINAWVTPDRQTLGQIMDGAISARNIKAIRFGLIVRASEPDTALKSESGAGQSYTELLFAQCPGGWRCDTPQRIPLVVSQSGEPYGWRYRKYETTVALQNAIWN